MESFIHPWAKLFCSKSVRNASKQGESTLARKRQSAGAMGKVSTPKKSHEGRSKGSDPFKERRERSFSTDCIPEQEREKINRFIPAEACAH
jgi:hypothetical protein